MTDDRARAAAARSDVSARRLLRRRDLLLGASGAALSLVGCRSSATEAPLPPPSPEARSVVAILDGISTLEGAGVRLRRTIGSRALPLLDPFLLLDDIRSDRPEDYERGFPEHPHRGFETVTYVISGAVEHRDSVGNHGRLVDGSAQWMTAGHGIVHSEMPARSEGLFWGLQLWVNLPRASKMVPPRYQDIPRERIAELSIRGARARLVAGELQAERGPVDGIVVAPTMLDVTVAPGETFEHELPAGHTAFAYGLDGHTLLGAEGAAVQRAQIGVLGAGALVRARGGPEGARFLLLAGQPIGEPVARRGPFVMNTEEELDRAFAEYRAGTLTRI